MCRGKGMHLRLVHRSVPVSGELETNFVLGASGRCVVSLHCVVGGGVNIEARCSDSVKFNINLSLGCWLRGVVRSFRVVGF